MFHPIEVPTEPRSTYGDQLLHEGTVTTVMHPTLFRVFSCSVVHQMLRVIKQSMKFNHSLQFLYLQIVQRQQVPVLSTVEDCIRLQSGPDSV